MPTESPQDERFKMLRNEWAKEVSEKLAKNANLESLLNSAAPREKLLIKQERIANQERINELLRLYKDWLPVVPMSRCPFCDEIVSHSIDSADLNGPWWYFYSPTRTEIGYKDPHAMAFDGAVELTGPIPNCSQLVKPGPQAPFVVPRLLDSEGVKAVLYRLSVGQNIAYTIWYFAEQTPEGVGLVNEWGTDTYRVRDGKVDRNGVPTFGWHQSFDFINDYDFDLAPWITRGKLQWIAPDDPDMKLHSEVEHCPYLDLQGLRQIMYIKKGRTWTGSSS